MLPEKTIESAQHPLNDILPFPYQANDFATVLDYYSVGYNKTSYYLEAGKSGLIQGWILDISVIRSRLLQLMKAVLPLLIKAGVPFKIPVNIDISDALLAGQFGYVNLGKLICIYPGNEEEALSLAKQLVTITQPFKGPAIPTDVHLGGAIYARYGGINPIIKQDASGGTLEYIYDRQGQLVPDEYPIPFIMLSGVEWPFGPIKSYQVPAPPKFLNDRIKPVAIIKADVKGRVIKGLYLKSWFQAKSCIIKEGKKYMCSDAAGHDIQDRIKWQLQLHNELATEVPLPRILDCFEENGDLYLVMEFIKGVSLDEKISSIYDGNSWTGLDKDKQYQLLDYLLQVIAIAGKLHEKGLVHRDLTSANFLINNKGKLYLIDLELVYSLRLRAPEPPFGIATYGFMSPEQFNNETPTIKEDIYALGALMIVFFTNLEPLKFETGDQQVLEGHLFHFIQEKEIALLIAGCMHPDRQQRPALPIIQDVIYSYRSKLGQPGAGKNAAAVPAPVKADLHSAINMALTGICSKLMTFKEGLWLSRKLQINQVVVNPQMSFVPYPGIYSGISGVLLMLSVLKQAGILPEPNVMQCYQHNITAMLNGGVGNPDALPAGLYSGSAGVAQMLATAMNAGLLPSTNDNTGMLRHCLDREPEGLDIMSGAAGQGIALLNSKRYLPGDVFTGRLQQFIELLLTAQQKDGSWITPAGNRGVRITGITQGVAGKALFLMLAGNAIRSERATAGAVKALAWLQQQARKQEGALLWCLHDATREMNIWWNDGLAGIAYTFIKAYEMLGNAVYKEMAVGALQYYAQRRQYRNLNYAMGLSGLGGVYLEAWRVLKDTQWIARAGHIASALLHLQKRGDEAGVHWMTDPMDLHPTADLMNGNSGIIYFLAGCLQEGRLPNPVVLQ